MTAGATLVLAWGNPGRRDDGLGPALAAALVAAELPNVRVEAGYQLEVEDAAELAGPARVVFVDADRTGPEPFSLRRLEPDGGGFGFTSHSVPPARLLALGRDLFGGRPEAWLLGIRGYEFDEFDEGLSPGATANLAAATSHLRAALAAGELRETPPTAPAGRRRVLERAREVDHG